MEEYKPEKNLEDKTAVDKSIEPLSTESELNIDPTDRIKHTSEQSRANISQGLNNPQDSSMVLPAVEDSVITDDQAGTQPVKISVSDDISKASDTDRIEKIWVDKAKAIIQDSVGDPHKKSANLSIEKSQYRTARFNKLINNH
ncbi:MAG TPA: hypothetical protein VMQ58_02255 [Candidatus Saccharimonadales bacterium]|jgi:hypothetical protein|nr:hypothetical protein [Candidatus Saccharimonadales bacterium]